MRSVTAIVLLAIHECAHAEDSLDMTAGSSVELGQQRTERLADKVADTLLDRVLNHAPEGSLGNTTLLLALAQPKSAAGHGLPREGASLLRRQVQAAFGVARHPALAEGRRGVRTGAGAGKADWNAWRGADDLPDKSTWKGEDMQVLRQRMQDMRNMKARLPDRHVGKSHEADVRWTPTRFWSFLPRLSGNIGSSISSRTRTLTGLTGKQLGAKLCTWYQYLLVARILLGYALAARIKFLLPCALVVAQVTDPYMGMFRALIPSIFGFDLSFMFAFYGLTLIRQRVFGHPW